jgi:hypothetical protein
VVPRCVRDRSRKGQSGSAVAESMTVSQILDRWLDSRKAQLSSATTDRYKLAIKHIDQCSER